MPRRQAVIAVLGIVIAGCAATNMQDVLAERRRGGGTSHAYAVSADVAFDIAREVLRTRGGDAIEEHCSEGFMLTSSSANELTRGTLMGVWVTPAGDRTVVTAVTKRKLPTSLVTTLTESGFHEHFAEVLSGRRAAGEERRARSSCAVATALAD